MKILWFTWKDKTNPLAGGAETVNEELVKRLAADGHEVVFLTAGYPNCKAEEKIDGYKIIRLGSRWSVYWRAYRYYKKNLVGWADLAIDEMNTLPFFAKFYVREKNIILAYQLCREIWFYQMFFPINIIGYLLEPVYLWLLRSRTVLTESESAKTDLQKYGFKKDNIFVFPIGLESKPISEKEFLSQKKEDNPTMLYLGSIRDMKRPRHVLRAFEIAKKKISNLKFFVVGSGNTNYAKKFFKKAKESKYSQDITCFGRVDNEKKLEMLKKSHLICVASVKEGWGLIVTEANSCGTPAVVYDTDGLKDSCKNGVTGIVCKKEPEYLAGGIIEMLKDKGLYEKYRLNAWRDSFDYTYERSYQIFIDVINKLL